MPPLSPAGKASIEATSSRNLQGRCNLLRAIGNACWRERAGPDHHRGRWRPGSAAINITASARWKPNLSTLTHDSALEALAYPFETGRLEWAEAGRTLFLGARYGPSLAGRAPGRFVQWFRPSFDLVQRGGWIAEQGSVERFPLVLLLPPRQREHARALYVHAVDRLAPEGQLVVAQPNSEGARSCQSDLEQLLGAVEVISKRKCRVLLSVPESKTNPGVAAQWRDLDQPSRIGTSGLLSRPGVFAWDRVDTGSQLLSEHLPADLQGEAADLGAGYGYLSVQLLQRCPGLRAVDLYEADQRALDLARQNLAGIAGASALGFHWHDVCVGLPKNYDCIVSNPPFHGHSGEDRPDLGRTFLRQAAIALRPGGRLLLVANRHLPYEATLAEGFSEIRQLVQAGGFKVIEAIRGGGGV